jgi:hypothetical protein
MIAMSVRYCMTLLFALACFAAVTLNPVQKDQDEDDDHNDPDQSNTPVSIAVPIAAKAAAEPAKQKDDKNNEQDRSKRHGFPLPGLAFLPKLISNARCANG